MAWSARTCFQFQISSYHFFESNFVKLQYPSPSDFKLVKGMKLEISSLITMIRFNVIVFHPINKSTKSPSASKQQSEPTNSVSVIKRKNIIINSSVIWPLSVCLQMEKIFGHDLNAFVDIGNNMQNDIQNSQQPHHTYTSLMQTHTRTQTHTNTHP